MIHDCGELRLADAGKTVTLAGWLENMREVGSNLAFVVLRDFYGTTQVVIESEEMMQAFKPINRESTISVTGVVRERTSKNPKQPTGEIEVVPAKIEVLGRCRYNELPFEINRSRDADEALRLKYRYLDLRNPAVKQNIILRCQVVAALRAAITTPILTASSPEGARDYLVPARKHPGKFYALPQAPQQFKQLLMTAGFDRYFQIAPCFRDEDARGDRSPGEFYQLDMEMAFATQDDVFSVLEDVLPPIFAKYGKYNVASEAPFRRISYRDAMDTYGSDKPDTRFGMELHDVTQIFSASKFKLFASAAATDGQYVKAINAKGAGAWPRAQIDKLANVAAEFGAKGLAWIAFREDGSVNSPIVKFFSDEEMEALKAELGVELGDLVMFAVADRKTADEILGGMRLHMANALDVPREGHDFLWVVNFPLFHWDDEAGRYEAEHQPFTLPAELDVEKIKADPLAIGSATYDFVMDGCEAGGGGMRIHDAELQLKMLEFMGFTEERAKEQFGFLMDALEYGAPPMGGFALGLDRVCMLLAGEDSIREVIPFPMNKNAQDLMMDAPSAVDPKQLADVHIAIVEDK